MMCAQNDVLMVSVHCVLDMIEDMPPVVLAELRPPTDQAHIISLQLLYDLSVYCP